MNRTAMNHWRFVIKIKTTSLINKYPTELHLYQCKRSISDVACDTVKARVFTLSERTD